MTRYLDDDATVIVGAVWYEDCDPFVHFVISRVGANDGTMHQTAERTAERIIEEERLNVLDEDCDEDCEYDCEEHEPSLHYATSEEMVAFVGLTPEQNAELAREGYLYL